jgi:hypothetical protein
VEVCGRGGSGVGVCLLVLVFSDSKVQLYCRALEWKNILVGKDAL